MNKDITEYEFNPVGWYSYRYEEVIVSHPAMNVHGLTKIDDKWYKQVPVYKEMPPVRYRKVSMLDSLFGFNSLFHI